MQRYSSRIQVLCERAAAGGVVRRDSVQARRCRHQVQPGNPAETDLGQRMPVDHPLRGRWLRPSRTHYALVGDVIMPLMITEKWHDAIPEGNHLRYRPVFCCSGCVVTTQCYMVKPVAMVDALSLGNCIVFYSRLYCIEQWTVLY